MSLSTRLWATLYSPMVLPSPSRSEASLKCRLRDDEPVKRPSPKRTRREPLCSSDAESNCTQPYIVDPDFTKMKSDVYFKVNDTLFPCVKEKLQGVDGILRDMFEFQQSDDAYVEIGGLCSEVELRALLQHLYGMKKCVRKIKTQENRTRIEFDLEDILNIVRISYRMTLPTCRKHAVGALHTFFGLMWKHIENEAPPPEESSAALFGFSMEKVDVMRVLSFKMIRAFREADLPFYLPFAYYFASQQTVDDIIDGIQTPDGMLITLSPYDQKMVMRAREALRHMRRNVTFEWLIRYNELGPKAFNVHGCTGVSPTPSGRTCHEFVSGMYNAFFAPGSLLLEDRCDALESMPFKALEVMKNHLCPYCYKFFDDRIRESLKTSWHALPKIFGTTWEELRKVQAEYDSEWAENL